MQFISDGKFLAIKVKQRQNSLRIMVFVSQLGLTVIGKTQSFKASLIYYVPPHYFIVCLALSGQEKKGILKPVLIHILRISEAGRYFLIF